MMGYLPQSTHLGKLELIEVYEFYDQPILFSCRNASDAIFMGVFADEDDDFETWLYIGYLSIVLTKFVLARLIYTMPFLRLRMA